MTNEEIKKAVKGVSGMMRFGNHDSPVLLECLGDLLKNDRKDDHENISAKRLAALAYLKASQKFSDSLVIKKYIKLINVTLLTQQPDKKYGRYNYESIKKLLEDELKKSDKTFTEIKNDEILWRKANKDLDKEFKQKYYKDSISINEQKKVAKKSLDEYKNYNNLYLSIALILCSIIAFILIRKRKKTLN